MQLSVPFQYLEGGTALFTGFGLMAQTAAQVGLLGLPIRKLIAVDSQPEVQVGTNKIPIADAAHALNNPNGVEIVAETLDVTNSAAVAEFFGRHQGISHLMHTVGISPAPLTPPEDIDEETYLKAYDVNAVGMVRLVKYGLKAGSYMRGARGVIVLSTSGTVGSEGRASAAYEMSKAALAQFIQLQSRRYAEKFGLVLNGIAPSPLRGPMAAQNPDSAARLAAVEAAMPLGELTNPQHISAAMMYFLSTDCHCVGEINTIDGGYTKHRPVFRGEH